MDNFTERRNERGADGGLELPTPTDGKVTPQTYTEYEGYKFPVAKGFEEVDFG